MVPKRWNTIEGQRHHREAKLKAMRAQSGFHEYNQDIRYATAQVLYTIGFIYA